VIRILLADDHAIVRSGLGQLLRTAPDFVVMAEASNGHEVLGLLAAELPDVLLLDVNMPGGPEGSELMRQLRERWPLLPVLVLSMHNEPQVAARMVQAGARGYITKDSDMGRLFAAIRRVAGGGHYMVPELAEQMVFAPVAGAAAHEALSPRETEIFALLAQGQGVNDIALRLGISNKTVSTHKARMMEKLELESTADLVRYALQHRLI